MTEFVKSNSNVLHGLCGKGSAFTFITSVAKKGTKGR